MLPSLSGSLASTSSSTASATASSVTSSVSSTVVERTKQIVAEVVGSSDVKDKKASQAEEKKIHASSVERKQRAERGNLQWNTFQAAFEKGPELPEAELKARDAVSILPSALQKASGFFSNQDLVTFCLLQAYMKQYGNQVEQTILPLIRDAVYDEKSLKEIFSALKSLTEEQRGAIVTLLKSVYRDAPLCSQRGSSEELREATLTFINQTFIIPLCKAVIFSHKEMIGKEPPFLKELLKSQKAQDVLSAIAHSQEETYKFFEIGNTRDDDRLTERGLIRTFQLRSKFAFQELFAMAKNEKGGHHSAQPIVLCSKAITPANEPTSYREVCLQLDVQLRILRTSSIQHSLLKDVHILEDSNKLPPFCVLDIIGNRISPVLARLVPLKDPYPNSALEVLIPDFSGEQLFLKPDAVILISLLREFRKTFSDKACDLNVLNTLMNLELGTLREEWLSRLSEYFYKHGIDFTDKRNAIRALWAAFDQRQRVNIRHRTPFTQKSYEALVKELVSLARGVAEQTSSRALPDFGTYSVMGAVDCNMLRTSCASLYQESQGPVEDGIEQFLMLCRRTVYAMTTEGISRRIYKFIEITNKFGQPEINMQVFMEAVRKTHIYQNQSFANKFEETLLKVSLMLTQKSAENPQGGLKIKKMKKYAFLKCTALNPERMNQAEKDLLTFFSKYEFDFEDMSMHLDSVVEHVEKMGKWSREVTAFCSREYDPRLLGTQGDPFFLRKQAQFERDRITLSELPNNGYAVGNKVLCNLILLVRELKRMKERGVNLEIAEERRSSTTTSSSSQSVTAATRSSTTTSLTSTATSRSSAAREISLIDLGPAPTLTHQASQNMTTFKPLLDLTVLFSAAVDRLQKQKGEAHHTSYSNALTSMRRVLPILEILLNCKEKEVQVMLCSELYHTMHTTFEQLLSAIVLLNGEQVSHDLETLLTRTRAVGLKLEGQLVMGPLLNGSPFVYRYPNTSNKGLVVTNVSLVNDPEGFTKLVRANLYAITTEFVQNLTRLFDCIMDHDETLWIDGKALDLVDESAEAIRTKTPTEESFFESRFELDDTQKARLKKISERAEKLEAELQALFKRMGNDVGNSVLSSYRDCLFHLQRFKACCKWEDFFQPRYLDTVLTPAHMSTCMTIENLFHSSLKTKRKGADIQEEIAKIRHDLEKYYKHIWNKPAPTCLTSLNQLFGHYIHGTTVNSLARLILASRMASINAYIHGQDFRRQEDAYQRDFKGLMEETLQQMEQDEKHLRVMVDDIASKLGQTEENKQENKTATGNSD